VSVTALAALSLVLTPALAANNNQRIAAARAAPRGGTFTPAIADPRLAAELARRGVQPNLFRLTPSVAPGTGKAVRVALRGHASAPAAAAHGTAEASASAVTAITPTVYSLGASVGWKRFALTGDVDRVEGGAVPGAREQAQVGVSYSLKRFTARAEAGVARSDATTPTVVADPETYVVGVGGSYRIARNFDVTGGVRYKIQRDRLEPLADQRRDSQSVYIGTAFRF
jgi:Gram-negative porin